MTKPTFQARYQIDIEQGVGTSETEIIRDGMTNYNRALLFLLRPDPTGAGYFEITYSSIKAIKDSSAIYERWDLDEVDALSKDEILNYINGWRVVVVSGNMLAQVRGAF